MGTVGYVRERDDASRSAHATGADAVIRTLRVSTRAATRQRSNADDIIAELKRMFL